jgi:hypothetical protein
MHQQKIPAPLDRRSFLQTSLVGVSALALGTCVSGGRGRHASAEPADSAISRHRLPEQPAPPANSRVAVVRSGAHPGHREAVQRTIALAGGLEFIRPGETVLLKPAVNSGNGYPATTDPETVWVVAEMVKEAGGEPFVADRTMFLHSTEDALQAQADSEMRSRARAFRAALDSRGRAAGVWQGAIGIQMVERALRSVR